MREEIALNGYSSISQNRISILAGLTRLRQICCDPRLFCGKITKAHIRQARTGQGPNSAAKKTAAVCSYSLSLQSMLSMIEEELAQEGIETFYLRGSYSSSRPFEYGRCFQ